MTTTTTTTKRKKKRHEQAKPKKKNSNLIWLKRAYNLPFQSSKTDRTVTLSFVTRRRWLGDKVNKTNDFGINNVILFENYTENICLFFGLCEMRAWKIWDPFSIHRFQNRKIEWKRRGTKIPHINDNHNSFYLFLNFQKKKKLNTSMIEHLPLFQYSHVLQSLNASVCRLKSIYTNIFQSLHSTSNEIESWNPVRKYTRIK